MAVSDTLLVLLFIVIFPAFLLISLLFFCFIVAWSTERRHKQEASKRHTHSQKNPYPHCVEGCKFTIGEECKYREMHVPTVAVDFDKVIFTHDSWQGHEHYGDLINGARESMIELRKMGFKIMIWTTRDQTDLIAEACKKYEIPYDYINQNPNQPPEINPSKPVADYYIDDRAVYFQTWDLALNEIKAREVHDPYYPIKK